MSGQSLLVAEGYTLLKYTYLAQSTLNWFQTTPHPDQILVMWTNDVLPGKIHCSLNYPDYSLIQTPVWEPIPIPQQKVTYLSGNSVIRTVSLGTEVSG